MSSEFDRTNEDLGNIVGLGHVNTVIPDQYHATMFYVSGLGFTRDPYLVTGVNNMWINVGTSQFHLPAGKPQVVRGHVGLVLPDREELLNRLTGLKKDLDETLFSFVEHDSYVETVSPWGNVMRCYEPEARFGPVTLGMPYVELDVPVGTTPSIARFYREILGTRGEASVDEHGAIATCSIGHFQDLIFRETDRPVPAFDGHHVQIYIVDFSGPYQKLKERSLISEESSQWQYRFENITDLDSGEVLFTIDHEVRSMTHPLYGRPLINRNPASTNVHFAPGQEDIAWSVAY